MKWKRAQKTMIILAAAIVGCLAILPALARAHCDTLGGPVVKEARVALEKGDITSILKWVKKENEAELRTAFDITLDKDISIDAGREFVEAYVTYVHYVEAVHAAIVAAGGDHNHNH